MYVTCCKTHRVLQGVEVVAGVDATCARSSGVGNGILGDLLEDEEDGGEDGVEGAGQQQDTVRCPWGKKELRAWGEGVKGIRQGSQVDGKRGEGIWQGSEDSVEGAGQLRDMVRCPWESRARP